MSAAVKTGMTVDEFLVWTETLEDDTKYELLDGTAVAMAPERVAHVRAKGLVFERLRAAIRDGALPCEALSDGLGVRVAPTILYIPDAIVRCGGPPLDPDQVEVTDPTIVVEVLSPSTRHIDLSRKFIGYFALSSLRHYLVISLEDRTVLHHRRREDGVIESRVVGHEPLLLNPPGLLVQGLFPTDMV